MSFVIIPKKDPKKLQNLWAPSLTTVHISLVGWDQGAWLGFDLRRFVSNCRLYEVIAKHGLNKEYINIGQALMTIAFKGHQAFRWWLTIKSFLKQT